MAAFNRISVMEGRIADFQLAEILQVLSLGRQYTGVELFDAEHRPTGSVFIKSGKIVHAAAAGLLGKPAFLRLFEQQACHFEVFRIDTPALIPEPIGSVRELLFEVYQRSEGRRESRLPPHASGVHAAVRGAQTRAPYVVAVASPKGGCGKTSLALNLAQSLAHLQQRVILIEGDLHGDVLSSGCGRQQARVGVFDVMLGGISVQEALHQTQSPNLHIRPGTGEHAPGRHLSSASYAPGWQELLAEASERCDVVLVDTPAGMLGVTHQILSGCTHVLGVLQAEPVAQRSFPMFEAGLKALPPARRPQVLGVIVNMLQADHPASAAVLEAMGQQPQAAWLFETAIPRSRAFLDATHAGVPLHLLDEDNPPAVARLFDALATEIAGRLGLHAHAPANEHAADERRLLA